MMTREEKEIKRKRKIQRREGGGGERRQVVKKRRNWTAACLLFSAYIPILNYLLFYNRIPESGWLIKKDYL